MKLIKLDIDENIKINHSVQNFLNPDFIYIPIENHAISYKKNTKIKKGELIFNTYSSISGHVAGIKECTLWNAKKERCLVIANDFEENIGKKNAIKKNWNHLTEKEIKKNLIDLEEKQIFSFKNIKHILISGIDDEPYIKNESFIQKEHTKVILETIDCLLNLFPDAKSTIAIKNTDNDIIEVYHSFLGTYKNIELALVEDLYLIGEENYLTEKLHITKDYLYLKTSDLLKFYNNIKKRKPIFETYITLTGNAIKKPQVIYTKLGVRIADILTKYCKINTKDVMIYTNGLMKGNRINIKNLIVTKDLQGIVIMKKEEREEKECIKCGKCIEVCPIQSNPLLAYKKQIKVPCINCGLCSYICPSYIHLRKYLTGDKDD